MTETKAEILKAIEDNRAAIRGFGVRRLGLFGSCARGDDSPSSDMDFVVEFERKSFDSYMGLKLFLEDLFGRPVDLVISSAIKPGLRQRILKELVYAAGL